MPPFTFSSFPIFLNRKRQMNGARQSLNTKQINHLVCHSWTLHLWTSVALTKNSVWTLAQSVSNKWTQPKLNNQKNPEKLSLSHFSPFLTESWILPCLLCTYIFSCGQREGVVRAVCNMIRSRPLLCPPPKYLQCGFFCCLFVFKSDTCCGNCQPL